MSAVNFGTKGHASHYAASAALAACGLITGNKWMYGGAVLALLKPAYDWAHPSTLRNRTVTKAMDAPIDPVTQEPIPRELQISINGNILNVESLFFNILLQNSGKDFNNVYIEDFEFKEIYRRIAERYRISYRDLLDALIDPRVFQNVKKPETDVEILAFLGSNATYNRGVFGCPQRRFNAFKPVLQNAPCKPEIKAPFLALGEPSAENAIDVLDRLDTAYENHQYEHLQSMESRAVFLALPLIAGAFGTYQRVPFIMAPMMGVMGFGLSYVTTPSASAIRRTALFLFCYLIAPVSFMAYKKYSETTH
jgi:hypothetical protein